MKRNNLIKIIGKRVKVKLRCSDLAGSIIKKTIEITLDELITLGYLNQAYGRRRVVP